MVLNTFYWRHGPLIILTTLCIEYGSIAGNGVLAIPFKEAHWNSCSCNATSYWTVGMSLRTCIGLCYRWPNCTAITYIRRYHACGLVKKQVNVAEDIVGSKCVYILKDDFDTQSMDVDPCDNCTTDTSRNRCSHDSPSCNVQACQDLIVPHGDVHGNMRQIGARRRLDCHHGPGTSFPVCQPDGTWSDLLICDEPTTTTTCPSGFCDSSCTSLHTATVIMTNNLTIIHMPQQSFSHVEAELCCKDIGQLLRIDSPEKLDKVENMMQGYGVNTVDCLWIQGSRASDKKYKLDDGVRMPMLDSVWNDDINDLGRDCVAMENNDGLIDRSCVYSSCGYLCERP